MAVSIRLRRMGRKKQPHYRVVVAESEHARDGRFVESLGFYKPLSHPARLVLDLERVDYWIGKGAQPSGTVRSLIGKARRGGDDALILGEADVGAEKAKRAEMLAERRAAEKKKVEAAAQSAAQAAAQSAAQSAAEAAAAEAAAAEVPTDVADTPGGSSAGDASAAEAMAEGEAGAVAAAEDAEPSGPPEGSMKKSSASQKKSKKKDGGEG